MSSNTLIDTVYTPEQVATMLQLSKNTVYELIGRGEIVAKKFGRVYRVPARSISFMFNGLDADIYEAEQVDRAATADIHRELAAVRAGR